MKWQSEFKQTNPNNIYLAHMKGHSEYTRTNPFNYIKHLQPRKYVTRFGVFEISSYQVYRSIVLFLIVESDVSNLSKT